MITLLEDIMREMIIDRILEMLPSSGLHKTMRWASFAKVLADDKKCKVKELVVDRSSFDHMTDGTLLITFEAVVNQFYKQM